MTTNDIQNNRKRYALRAPPFLVDWLHDTDMKENMTKQVIKLLEMSCRTAGQ